MFIFKNGFHVTTTKIRGVNYTIFSFYGGEKDVFEHIGALIESSFNMSTADEITNESLVDSGIDKSER